VLFALFFFSKFTTRGKPVDCDGFATDELHCIPTTTKAIKVNFMSVIKNEKKKKNYDTFFCVASFFLSASVTSSSVGFGKKKTQKKKQHKAKEKHAKRSRKGRHALSFERKERKRRK
jgi:hypothetical protein